MVCSIASLLALSAAGVLSSAAPPAALAQTSSPAPAPSPAAETIRVQVLGAVARPGNIELRAGDRLLLALARAGVGENLYSDLSRVHLLRGSAATDGTTPLTYQIDMYQATQHGDLRFDPVLRNGDKIYVPESAGRRPYVVPPFVPTA
jgi:hypothetical protein